MPSYLKAPAWVTHGESHSILLCLQFWGTVSKNLISQKILVIFDVWMDNDHRTECCLLKSRNAYAPDRTNTTPSFLSTQLVIYRNFRLLISFKRLSYVIVNIDCSSDIIVLQRNCFETGQKGRTEDTAPLPPSHTAHLSPRTVFSSQWWKGWAVCIHFYRTLKTWADDSWPFIHKLPHILILLNSQVSGLLSYLLKIGQI